MGKLAFNLLPAVIAGEATQWVNATKRSAVIYAVAVILVLGAFAMTLAAAAVALGQVYGLPIGLLAVAGALAACAAIVIVAARIAAARRSRMRDLAPRRTEIHVAAAAAALPIVMRSKPLLLAALGAGALAWVASSGRDIPER